MTITLTHEEAHQIEQYIKPYAIVPVDMETTQLLVNALRAKLSNPEPEPVAWIWDVYNGAGYSSRGIGFQQTDIPFAQYTPLYTATPQREWQGLTEQEHANIAVEAGCASADWMLYGAAVERALKEKNQ